MSAGKVDVLAVLGCCAELLQDAKAPMPQTANDLREARAAVAELIEAADLLALGSHKKAGGGWWVVRNDRLNSLRAALAKVQP